ncbi:hypothetical protein [Pseudolysinimonas yzui]|uniref:hypothetical protein n=1 Tax=Pseudolysinimonas yzui TaxID=2708254 RepID=UPI0017499749|nr:hypothetical protein [Pseudolysinimonas yzui]
MALLVFACILVVGRLRGRAPVPPQVGDERGGPARAADRTIARRRRFLHRLALVAPWVIVAPFVVTEALPFVDVFLRYTAPALAVAFPGDPLDVRWWVYAAPPAAATVCFAVVFVVLSHERAHPEVPVTPVVRRGWAHFVSRRDAAVATAALALFVLTALIAGGASSPDDNGWFSRLEIPVGETGPGSMTFFGWAYSVPALVAIAVLTALVVGSLRNDSFRPFVRPETVGAETAARRDTAALLTRLFIATILLTLGGAWFMIGGAGTGAVGVGIPGFGMFMFSAGYASFAPAFVVAGVALQAAAVVLLLLTIRMRRRLGQMPAAPAHLSTDVAA